MHDQHDQYWIVEQLRRRLVHAERSLDMARDEVRHVRGALDGWARVMRGGDAPEFLATLPVPPAPDPDPALGRAKRALIDELTALLPSDYYCTVSPGPGGLPASACWVAYYRRRSCALMWVKIHLRPDGVVDASWECWPGLPFADLGIRHGELRADASEIALWCAELERVRTDPRVQAIQDLAADFLRVLPDFFQLELPSKNCPQAIIKCYFGTSKEYNGLHWMHIFIYANSHNYTGICARFEARSWHLHTPKSDCTFTPTADKAAAWWSQVDAWARDARSERLKNG